MDILVGSSRSNYMWKYFKKNHPYPHLIDIYARSGAKLEFLQYIAYSMIRHSDDPTNCHVYFVAGLNDLTRMDCDPGEKIAMRK